MSLFKKRQAPSEPARPGLAPPTLATAEYVYDEQFRLEDQAGLRSDEPPAASREALYESRSGLRGPGAETLYAPPAFGGAKLAAVHPSRGAVAFVDTHLAPEPLYHRGDYSDPIPLLQLPGFRRMASRGTSLCGISWSPDGTTLACLEWNSGGVLTLLDPASGARTFLTMLEGVSGAEEPQWSPDGRWLLIGTHPQPQLVSLDHQVIVKLPLEKPDVDWWPAHGPATLLTISEGPDGNVFGTYNLERAEHQILGPIQQPQQADLDLFRRHVYRPRVAPDGTRALVGSRLGPSGAYQIANGSRHRVSMIDLTTGQLNILASAFLDPAQWVEREHDRWAWVGDYRQSHPVTVGNDLLSSATPLRGPDPTDRFDDATRDETLVIWSW